MAARCGNGTQKLTWTKLINLDIVLTGSMLAISLAAGIGTYLSKQDSFKMAATMHKASYLSGILGGMITTIYIYNTRKPITLV